MKKFAVYVGEHTEAVIEAKSTAEACDIVHQTFGLHDCVSLRIEPVTEYPTLDPSAALTPFRGGTSQELPTEIAERANEIALAKDQVMYGVSYRDPRGLRIDPKQIKLVW